MSVKLSKTKYILGLQCEKALYLDIHQPELADKPSQSQEFMFQQGNDVGILAQKYYPHGVVIKASYKESNKAIEQTQQAIKNGALTIFEATFVYKDVLVKIDILNRKSTNHEWEIVEVKSSTSVKEVHIADAAIQYWVCTGASLKVSSVSIMTINNKCTFPKLKSLFKVVNITNKILSLQNEIPEKLNNFKKLLSENSHPQISIGQHCYDPYCCKFKSYCWSKHKIPELSVFDIPGLSSKRKWEYFKNDKLELKKVEDDSFNEIQSRMISHSISKKRFVNKKAIKSKLKAWKYPMSFLDFETIGFAIPRYNGQHPYQQMPFQFSCHVKQNKKSKLEHFEYLHTENTDPREQVCQALVNLVPSQGSVTAYNMGFEANVLRSLAEKYPKFEKELLGIVERLVDPLPIIRDHVYDHKFQGSFSLKNVAPAILGKSASYDGMKVGDGTDAQTAYIEMIDAKTSIERRDELKISLIEYCTKDTFLMVKLVEWMCEVIK